MKKDNKKESKNVSSESRRKIRRRRQIRNQILAYMLLIVIMFGIGLGGYYGVRKLADFFNAKRAETEARISENLANTDSVSEEDAIISTPDNLETVSEDSTTEDEPEAADVDPDVLAAIGSMSAEEKAGALIMTTPEALTGVNAATQAGEGTKAALEKYPVGILIYDKDNWVDSDQFRTLISKTKDMYAEAYASENELRGLFVAVKEDGSANKTISLEEEISSAPDLGSSGDNTNAYHAYLAIGSALNEYNIDMNIAPLCDVAVDGSYETETSFGSDADIVASMAGSAVSGLSDQNIISCIYTFPGQGGLDSAPKGGMTETDRTLDDLRAFEYKPFESAINEGAGAIMVGNLAVSDAEGNVVPAYICESLIDDDIRGQLGFNGVVITDDLAVIAKDAEYSPQEAALRAINAGVDMVYVSSDFEATYQYLVDSINDGAITEERLNDALVHIYTMKKAAL